MQSNEKSRSHRRLISSDCELFKSRPLTPVKRKLLEHDGNLSNYGIEFELNGLTVDMATSSVQNMDLT